MFQSVPNTELTCTICGGFWQDTDVKLRDLQRGEDQGCSTCNIMLQAINSFLPWILWRAGPLKAAILSVDAIVFHWDASNKAIYYEGTPEYPLYLSTDGEVETGHQLFSQHDTASGDTGTVASLRRIPPWINTCISQHSACGEPKDTPLPRRVLEIGETEGALIKLYESQNELARYACLSHRWGTGQPIVTTSESYDKLVKGIPSEELPLTFRDAVSVARRLSIRYLWIDCFCIIQDNAKDLEEACAMMDVIFENAFLTIAATRSEGPDDGLFVRRYAERRIQRLQIPGTEFWGKSDIYVRNFNHGEEDDLSSQHWITAGFSQGFSSGWPLLLRGWVFQERILSPRMLHFGNEITWECRSESVCECNFKASSGALQDSKHRLREEGCSLWSSESSTSTLHLTWKRVVEEYSELASNLTYERDIFPALSGLASRFSRLLSDEYVAGMWRKHLIQGLLWVVPSSPEGGVPLKWRAPTWSWASVCCAVSRVSRMRTGWEFALRRAPKRKLDLVSANMSSQVESGEA
ncbi:hypothetical protein H2200_007478 [Cladophialophora chaetospira]|uniref:Heterokaryon incompatibility domain-containing protein n=1 Tax=Cladophialophora chaetospira TaxID=386627 RepID=A0AA38X7V5_9EURO|nr:hypothetical protein H2200_007478 [Cladophialophora chaetospira]